MTYSPKEKSAWSIVKRAQSFAHAARGIRLFFATTPNAWIHTFIAGVVVVAGFYFQVSFSEWLVLVLTMGFVLVIEILNTAVEIDMNLTSPDFHPYARDTKDVAAGAVLVAAFISIIVGLIIFLPKIFYML